MIDLELGEKLEKAARPRTTFEGDCFGGYNNWEYVASDEQSALVDWLWANAQALIAAAREVNRLLTALHKIAINTEDGDWHIKLIHNTATKAIYYATPQPEAATDAPLPASRPGPPGPGSTAR